MRYLQEIPPLGEVYEEVERTLEQVRKEDTKEMRIVSSGQQDWHAYKIIETKAACAGPAQV